MSTSHSPDSFNILSIKVIPTSLHQNSSNNIKCMNNIHNTVSKFQCFVTRPKSLKDTQGSTSTDRSTYARKECSSYPTSSYRLPNSRSRSWSCITLIWWSTIFRSLICIPSTQLNTNSSRNISRRIIQLTTVVMGNKLWKASSSYPVAYPIIWSQVSFSKRWNNQDQILETSIIIISKATVHSVCDTDWWTRLLWSSKRTNS